METYLDHNATTPLDSRVLDAMLPYLQTQYGNPSSVYRQGRLARQAIEYAREQVARLVNVHPSQVIFTSGGTEANNFAIKGTGNASLAVSAIEHASVLEPARQLARRGVRLVEIGVDDQGRVTDEKLQEALSAEPGLVSVMTANNETGVIQDIARLAEMSRSHGALLHTDAVQALGKMEVDFAAFGAHLMTLSSHKLYGPKGAGALVIDRHVELEAQQLGGGQESGYRSGTENVAAIVGFGKAAELALHELDTRRNKVVVLREKLLRSLTELENVAVFAKEAHCLANTIFLALPGIDGETLLMEMDRAGVAISSGSACDSQKGGPSHTLLAMGVDPELARCAVRVSFGQQNSETDIDAFLAILKQQLQVLRESEMLAWA
jgi:cysteine desulfurase